VSKYIDESIIVHVDRGEAYPAAFIWRKRLYRISEILAWWREPAAWWEGEPVRVLVRVTAAGSRAGVFELCQRDSGWFLHRLLD
jgi:hypothetical protein